MKTLLLTVDLQEDFLSHPELRPHRAQLQAKIQQLMQRCREQGVAVAHVRMEVSDDPDQRMPHWKTADRWLCRHNTPGAEAPAGCEAAAEEKVFVKTGFDAFIGTGLAEWLQEQGIRRLWVAGLHTHTCIRQTALNAYQLGFEVSIGTDVVGSYAALEAASTLGYLQQRGIATCNSAEWFSPEQTPAAEDLKTRIQAAKQSNHNQQPMAAAPTLLRLAELLKQEHETLAELITSEVKKPIQQSRQEVQRAIQLIEVNVNRHQQEALEEDTAEGLIRHRPRGTVAMITPWNNPLAIPIGQLVPALLYGNHLLWKPSPHGQAVAQQLRSLMSEAGIDDSQVALLEGGSAAAFNLASSPEVDAVTFTGSCDAAWSIAAACHANGTPLQSEMGGNNAAILWPGIEDSETIARQVAEAAFGFAGQRCTAIRRVIVPAAAAAEWMGHLAKATLTLPWGDPTVESTVVGPVISDEKIAEVSAMIERARPHIEQIRQPHLENSRQSPTGGSFFSPTLILCSQPQSEIVQEESFAPLLIIQPADDFQHALQLLNGVRHGLTATLVGGSADEQQDFELRAEAGILRLGEVHAGAGIDTPFQGWKASGWGPGQHGSANRAFYTKTQSIYRRT